jgi:hypothetical protein
MKIILSVILCLLVSSVAFAQDWRKLTAEELKTIVPEKAPVIKEDIETELRTAAGITDGKSHILGVVIITAGYEADGKFTHFLRCQSKLTVGMVNLEAGDYVFGYKRVDNTTLRVSFYHARSGEFVGNADAKVETKKGPIYSFLIEPPIEKKGKMYIGRFSMEYSLGK